MTNKTVLVTLVLLNLALLVLTQGTGTQFITGACKSDADCASGCCGFKSGKCAGPIIAQERDGGCGFGDPTPNYIAAQVFRASQAAAAGAGTPTTLVSVVVVAAATPAAPNTAAANPAGAGNKVGTQFITGACTSDADCASACCGFHSGKCAGPVIAQEQDGGCGFGDATPNDTAAQAFRASQAMAAAGSGTVAGVGANAAASPAAVAFDNPAGAGMKDAQQFITGLCTSDADCASACCGFKSGKCAGPIIAQTRDGGCGFGDQQPNAIAAKNLGFTG